MELYEESKKTHLCVLDLFKNR